MCEKLSLCYRKTGALKKCREMNLRAVIMQNAFFNRLACFKNRLHYNTIKSIIKKLLTLEKNIPYNIKHNRPDFILKNRLIKKICRYI